MRQSYTSLSVCPDGCRCTMDHPQHSVLEGSRGHISPNTGPQNSPPPAKQLPPFLVS